MRNLIEEEQFPMLFVHVIDDEHAIIVDRETGVCYLQFAGWKQGGLTVMLNADGTPKIWEGYQKEKSD